jgi:hypothetical protein
MTPVEARVAESVEHVVARVPFAGEELVVGRVALDHRPVFGASTLRRGERTLRAWEAVDARPWPAHPLPAADARALVASRIPGGRVGAAAVEGFLPVGGGLEPVFRVDAVLPGPSVWALYVSAEDGRPLGAERTSREARGRVYATNPLDSGTMVVDLPGIGGELLDGPLVRSRSCAAWTDGGSALSLADCTAFARHAVADDAGDFLYFSAPGSYRDPFAEVHLYFHADRFSRWLDDRYGLRLPYAPLWANANFPLANAFFGDFDLDGVPEVSFGTDAPTGTDFAYDADVVYHELGHAVVAEWAPSLPFLSGDAVGLEWAGGSVNEGLADVFSMIHAPDPWTGEFAGSAFGEVAIRDLTEQRRCPDDLVGEVHADGEIFASFGWQLVSDPEVGPDLVAELLAGVVPRLAADVTWERIGAAVRAAADDLERGGLAGDRAHAAILAHLEASGMESCGRVIPLDGGATAELLLVNAGLLGPLARLPGGAGLSIDVPADAQGVVVTASGFEGPAGMGFALYGRWGEPVGHEFTVVEALGLGFATPVTYDFVVEGGAAEGLELELGSGDGPELRPGDTLYLSVASVNQGPLAPLDFVYARLDVEAEVLLPPAAPPAPTGCATGGPATGLTAVLAGLLAISRRGARGR